MKIRKILVAIAQYYQSARRAGHSTIMMRGIASSKKQPIIVVHDRRQAKFLDSLIPGANYKTIDELPVFLSGHALSPLLIDNEAMRQIAVAAVAQIDKLHHTAESLSTECRKAQATQIIDSQNLEIATNALRKIATADYRGNKHPSADIAQNALDRIKP